MLRLEKAAPYADAVPLVLIAQQADESLRLLDLAVATATPAFRGPLMKSFLNTLEGGRL